MKKYLSSAVIIYILFGLVVMPKACINYASQGVLLCLKTVVPSLFPFFICSKILTKNGFANVISKPLQPIIRPVFNVPSYGAFAFVIGILSGCPVGAQTVCDMYSQGLCSKAEAQRMICFCNNSGPLFIIGSVATGLLGFSSIGWVLLVSNIISAIVIGLIVAKYKKSEKISISLFNPQNKSQDYISASIKESIYTTAYVCGFVIIFSVMCGLIKGCGFIESIIPNDNFRGIFYGMLEMTNGIAEMCKSKVSTELICAISFVVGFGGVSVILQVDGIISKYKLSIWIFIASKFVQGLVSSFTTYTILKFANLNLPVFMSQADSFTSLNCWAYSTKFLLIFIGLGISLSITTFIGRILRRM